MTTFAEMISTAPAQTTETEKKDDDWPEIGAACQAGSITLSVLTPDREKGKPAPRPLLKIEKTGGRKGRGNVIWVQLTAAIYGQIGQYMLDNADAVLAQCKLADEKPTVVASPPSQGAGLLTVSDRVAALVLSGVEESLARQIVGGPAAAALPPINSMSKGKLAAELVANPADAAALAKVKTIHDLRSLVGAARA